MLYPSTPKNLQAPLLSTPYTAICIYSLPVNTKSVKEVCLTQEKNLSIMYNGDIGDLYDSFFL